MKNRTGSVSATLVVLGLCLQASSSAFAAVAPAPTGQLVKLAIKPDKITLSGRDTTQRYLVLGTYSDGKVRDLTATAKISKSAPVVKVEGAKISATANGKCQVTATVGGASASMQVTTQEVGQPQPWSFANEIVPLLTKSGCNTGGCHGSPSGRGGFRLSLFGYEPDYDYDMIVKDKNGARINKNQVSSSLVLQKPTMAVPHGGGMRFKVGSEFYARISDWLKAGAPKQPEFDPRLKDIQIYPTDWTLDKAGQQQQVLVMATRDDGTTQDVTQYARFTSQDDQVASVDDDGMLEAVGKGETSIMIRYLGGVGVVHVRVPRDPVPDSAFANFKPANYIDEQVLAKLKEVRLTASDPATDEEFLRRAYIDTCGITPTVEECKAFLDDKDPAKRTKLIDSLLNRPEFVDYWTLKWSDLLRNNSQVKEDKGLQVFYRWIRDSIKSNKPYNQFARELLVSSGSGFSNGPVNFYNTGDFGGDYPLLMASATSQVFLGVRIDCARCHNHPFEAWSQMDYYGLAAFFGRLKNKNGAQQNERIFVAANEGEVYHPRKSRDNPDALIRAKFLGGDVATFAPEEDRREQLANWITSPNNYWFKRSIANRLWNNFFGRGIISPVDDYRLTNPASNEKLLDALGEKVVAYKWNLKAIMRDILMSRTYQTSSVPNKLNVGDKIYATHAMPRRLYAEVLLDAVTYATGVNEQFGPYEYGRKAVSIPDNRVGNGFLDLFGRAKREIACECERSEETNVSMVLNMLNGSTINDRIANGNGRVALAINAKKSPKDMVEEFYLSTLCRRPTDKEQAIAQKMMAKAGSPKEGAEDLMWSLINMREFLFNH